MGISTEGTQCSNPVVHPRTTPYPPTETYSSYVALLILLHSDCWSDHYIHLINHTT